MNRIFKIVISFLTVLMLSSCFIAMPTKGPEEAQVNIGKTFELQRDILVVTYFTRPIAWETAESSSIGSNQKIIKTLKKGNKVKIKSVKSFRMPEGIHFAYRCVELPSGLTFDLNFSMQDSIGL